MKSADNLAKEEYFGLDINENTAGPTNIYHIETCSLVSLSVFKDRAELCRKIRPVLKVGKISLIVFKKISAAIDKDSFRVDVEGPGVIRDVFYRSVTIPDGLRAEAEKRKSLENEVAACNKRMKLLLSKLQRLKTQKSVIDGFSETLVEKRDEDFKDKTSMFDPKHMETLNSFLKLYDNQVEKIDSDLIQTQEEIESVQQHLENCNKEIDNLISTHGDIISRELSVMLECKEKDPVTLSVNYILSTCQWTPSYDIRIYSNDGNMKIFYYGQISQYTGEDWCPESMFLSTALPGTGDHVPELTGQSIRFKDIRRRPQKISRTKRKTKALSFHSKEDFNKAAEDGYLCFSDDNATMPIKEYEMLRSPTKEFITPLHTSSHMNGTVDKEEHNSKIIANSIAGASLSGTESGGPASEVGSKSIFHHQQQQQQQTSNLTNKANNTPVVNFIVPHPPTLVSSSIRGNLPTLQRAFVGIIDLHPSFEYLAVPRKTPHAFLRASCQNGSAYAILPGSANVFIDDNFIGKTTLDIVAPQEEFRCDLGVDHGIKINYKPIFKYREHGSGSRHSNINNVIFKQVIEIKNNLERNIQLTVRDQIPVSAEDKIKVHILEPVIKHGIGISVDKAHSTKQIRMIPKTNIVEWNLDLYPNEGRELTLKYAVEYPINEEIDMAFLSISDSSWT